MLENLLDEVLKHEVYPAMGCTEPVAVAFAAASAAKLLSGPATEVRITTDPATYKNGLAVTIPNTDGKKGNLLAAAIGAIIRKPELGAEIFRGISAELDEAKKLVNSGAASIKTDHRKHGIYIAAEIFSGRERALCVLENSHTEIARLIHNSRILVHKKKEDKKSSCRYKEELRTATMEDLFRATEQASPEQLEYIKKGVEMNLAASHEGMAIKKVGYYINDIIEKGFMKKDVFSEAKITAACATDARMAGLSVPVMSSGESGNQGVVAILVPWIVGKTAGRPEEKILKSIALSHLVNSYIKVFTGELAPICGCAVAAGVGASAAIVWQFCGANVHKVSLAVNTIISDIGGTLCDGAKSGCSLKVASSADSAIRAAYMAIHGEGITEKEGFIGNSAEETIQNIARISCTGMSKVDKIILDIMAAKGGMN
jgi:L-cysteine desulfidase